MNPIIYKIGYWSGLAAFMATATYSIIQVFVIFGFPRHPWDGILIYAFSLLIVIPFMLEMLTLHYCTPPERQYWTHASLLFTVLYAVFVTANYVVQLATVIPQSLKGPLEPLAVLDQTPHSMYWDYDAIGYIFMGLALLFAIPALGKKGIQKKARTFFLLSALITPFIAIVYFYPVFTPKLVLIALPWGITVPISMLLLAIFFKKKRTEISIKDNKNILHELQKTVQS